MDPKSQGKGNNGKSLHASSKGVIIVIPKGGVSDDRLRDIAEVVRTVNETKGAIESITIVDNSAIDQHKP